MKLIYGKMCWNSINKVISGSVFKPVYNIGAMLMLSINNHPDSEATSSVLEDGFHMERKYTYAYYFILSFVLWCPLDCKSWLCLLIQLTRNRLHKNQSHYFIDDGWLMRAQEPYKGFSNKMLFYEKADAGTPDWYWRDFWDLTCGLDTRRLSRLLMGWTWIVKSSTTRREWWIEDIIFSAKPRRSRGRKWRESKENYGFPEWGSLSFSWEWRGCCFAMHR